MIELLLEFYITHKLNTDNVSVDVKFNTTLKTLHITLKDHNLAIPTTECCELVYSLQNSEGLARLDFLLDKMLYNLMRKRYYKC